MTLGRFELALNVANLETSLAFYQALGFERSNPHADASGVAVVQCGDCRIALYQGYIAENLLNFRDGQMEALQAAVSHNGLQFERPPLTAADGSSSALLRDPDGNALYFVNHP